MSRFINNYLITVRKRHYACLFFVLSLGRKNVTCNVTKCVLEIGALISESSKSGNLKDLKRTARIRRMCPELFDTYITIKKLYIRYEKKIEYTAEIECPRF